MFKKIAFAALAILSITLGATSIIGSAHAQNYYGSPNNVADGGNG